MKVTRPHLARTVSIAFAVVSVVVTILIGRISVACHMPFASKAVQSAALIRLTSSYPQSWRAIHVLVAGCRCSHRIADHLVIRGPLSGVHESVVLVGGDQEIERLIKKSNLSITTISAEQSSTEFHLEGAPYLLIVAPDGSVHYAGGYAADRNVRDGYQDAAIWEAVSSGRTYASLPIFGCAAGTRSKRAVDPLRLRSIF